MYQIPQFLQGTLHYASKSYLLNKHPIEIKKVQVHTKPYPDSFKMLKWVQMHHSQSVKYTHFYIAMGHKNKLQSIRDEWPGMQATMLRPSRHFEFESIGMK